MNNRAYYEQQAEKYARMYHVPVRIFKSQIGQESGWNPTAHSGAGADGIAQIVPKYHPGVNTRDPVASLKYAAQLDANLIKKYGSVDRALSAYNSGRPDAYLNPHFAGGQTYNYVRSIKSHAGQYAVAGAKPAKMSPGRMTPQGANGLKQSLAAQNQGYDRVAGMRTAILGNLVDQQNAYLTHQPYAGPSMATTLMEFNVAHPAVDPTTGQQTTAATSYKVVSDHNKNLSPHAGGIINMAKKFLGTPYKWGGANPKTGFDCSGFVQWLYAQKGVKLGRTTYQQVNQGQHVGRKNLKPGDVIFFSKNGDVHHEALYIGNGQFIHAPHTGDVIKISSLSDPYYSSQFIGGRRF